MNSLLENTWQLEEGPGGNWQWVAPNGTRDYPSAFSNTTFNLPRMMTSDLALREDPIYYNISMMYWSNFTKLTEDFSKAWYVSLPNHYQIDNMY